MSAHIIQWLETMKNNWYNRPIKMYSDTNYFQITTWQSTTSNFRATSNAGCMPATYALHWSLSDQWVSRIGEVPGHWWTVEWTGFHRGKAPSAALSFAQLSCCCANYSTTVLVRIVKNVDLPNDLWLTCWPKSMRTFSAWDVMHSGAVLGRC